MDFLNTINSFYPVRRTEEQKANFRKYIKDEAERLGWSVNTDVGKHKNVIIGDPERARAVFTAHYDTPARSVIPNLMMPRNPILSFLYGMWPTLLAFLSVFIAIMIAKLFNLGSTALIVTYLIIYFGSYVLMSRAFINKHNKNDNTSGVATVMTLLVRSQRDDIAFILFDNEEKGLLGSKAYARKHRALSEEKLLINLDCVGNGKNIITIARDGALSLPDYETFKEALCDSDDFKVMHFPQKGSISSSDYKNFKCGIGVMACNLSPVGYFTSRIHTDKDTVADRENIDFLAERLLDFMNML